MITNVTKGDYFKIIKCFTEEEIKEKYGQLNIISQEDYKRKEVINNERKVN